MAIEDDGEEKTQWFVKCSNTLYKFGHQSKTPSISHAHPKYVTISSSRYTGTIL
jgi:hypothetical protein